MNDHPNDPPVYSQTKRAVAKALIDYAGVYNEEVAIRITQRLAEEGLLIMDPLPDEDVDTTSLNRERLENLGPKRHLFLRLVIPERAPTADGQGDYAVEDHHVIDVISDALIDEYLTDPYITVMEDES